MSVPASLLTTEAARSGRDVAVRWGPARELDRVHDHVLRLLGDEDAAAGVVADVARRAAARADELGESPTFDRLVQLAHARMAVVDPAAPSDASVARLAGDREPGGAALTRALSVAARRGVAVLDLTTRQEVDLKRAAMLIGIDPAAAATARAEALQEVRSALAADGLALDVEAALARLPVIGAPARVHRVADLPDVSGTSGRMPAPLAWFGSAAAVALTVAAVALGTPRLVAADTGDTAPVAVAEAVSDTPAARQLATPGDDVREDGVEQLVVREPATEPVAEESADDGTTGEQPTDQEPSDEEPSDDASPEPGSDPLELPLPTNP